MLKKNITGAAKAQGRVSYMLELARGSSHIASTRTPQTLNRAITEVLDGFCQVHGLHALDVFLELLALDVGQRGNRDAALAVSSFASGVDGRKEAGPVRDRPGKARTVPRGKIPAGT
ncbi:hypothetical protein PQR05_09625 [Paraburkholderia sediminicola]|uniref:Uncharacterized protein n=1 Tax=Paraburkholderia metrosideri TaxID=580937 RepID=A0ABW9DUS0_9BURK